MALHSPPGSTGTPFTGSLAATQVAFGSGANAISGSSALTFDGKGLTIASGSLTTYDPGLTVTQTWNNVSNVFGAMLINVTNTASAAGSLLQDWQVGGSTVANLGVNGQLKFTTAGSASSPTISINNAGLSSPTGNALVISSAGVGAAAIFGTTFQLPAASTFTWGTLTSTQTSGLAQNAPGVVEVNNGTAGTFAALKLSTLTATAAAPTVSAGQIGFGGTTSATATAGASITIPALAQGYIVVNIAGTTAKIPYFNA